MDRKRRWLLAVVCGVAVASIYAAQPILRSITVDLDLPTEFAGWLVATGQMGYLAGLVLLVPLGDRVDRRRLIAAHLALTALGMIMTALASVAWLAFVGLTMAGVFAVVVQISVAYAAATSAPGERGRNIGVVTSGVVVGILGARIAAGWLTDLWGWRSVYGILSVLALTLACLVLTLLPAETVTGHSRAYARAAFSSVGLLKERLFLTRGLISLFLFASFGSLWSGIALPLAAVPWHLTSSQIGLFGLAGIAGALGAGRAGRWADAGRTTLVTGLALAILLVAWAGIAQLPWSLWFLVAGIVLLDFAVQAVHVSSQHQLTAAHPDRTSSVIGGYMVFYSLGSAIGATATTATFVVHEWSGSSILGAAFAGCAMIIWLIDARIFAARRLVS